MRRTRSRLLTAVAVLVLALSFVLGWPGLVSAPVQVDALHFLTIAPILTLHPIVTLWPLDSALVVDIPDAKLSQRLHDLTGVAAAIAITRGDLYKLTGELDISYRNIQNLEGIQFCKNVTSVEASGNPIANVPDLSGMANCQVLYFDACDLAAIPAQVFTLPKLDYLGVDQNRIAAIPDFPAGKKLQGLYAQRNSITALPADIGDRVFLLDVSFNPIPELPESVVKGSMLYHLLMRGDELTTLPDAFKAKGAWGTLDFRYNFLDVSAGGAARKALTDSAVVAEDLKYDHQLAPVADLKAVPDVTSATLSWTAGAAMTDASLTASVAKYNVYSVEGGVRTLLATVDAGTTHYVDSGLAPATARTYAVEVVYSLKDVLMDVTSSESATATTQTLAAPTATPTATPTLEATPTAAPGGSSGGLPVWAWIVDGLLALWLVGVTVALAVVLRRTKK